MQLSAMIPAARGQQPVDLLLTNARLINVFSGEIAPADLAVAGGYIVGVGPYPAHTTTDLGGKLVAPGFIDAHCHIESAMTGIAAFARAVMPCGTTTVVADPHEIANVLGAEGIDYMLRASNGQPLNVYFMLPSCVPATQLETAGAILTADDLQSLLSHPKILGLAEMMNFPGVLKADPEVLRKIALARRHHKPIDGHAPGLTGRDLFAYLAAGISSDHECTTAGEAREKLAAGMHIMIREGSAAKNLQDLLPAVNATTARRMMWCTDDRHPHDLLALGHVDALVRQAIRSGLDPLLAIQMATINPADYFGLRDAGALAPGRRADLVVISDLADLSIEQVYCRGVRVAENGRMLAQIKTPEPEACRPSMQVDVDGLDFSIAAGGRHIRVIDLVEDQIITRQFTAEALVREGNAVADISADILKIAVVERHQGSQRIGKGFVRGFGLRRGALASSVAHDSHNIVVVGVSDPDMHTAVKAVVAMGGGLAVADQGDVRACLPLPIAGLMSIEPLETVRRQLDGLLAAAREFGSALNDPFMTLSFLALPVIPELKITDKGLVDVLRFEPVSLFGA